MTSPIPIPPFSYPREGFLTAQDIYDRRSEIFFDGFDAKDDTDFLQRIADEDPVGYDLRLGEEVYVSRKPVPFRLTGVSPSLVIEPGDFALLTTLESIHIPTDLVGFISLKFSIGRTGLVNISGFHVDPGYRGKIIFAVHNAGPSDVILRYREPTFKLLMATLTRRLKFDKHVGKYPGFTKIPPEFIQGLRGGPISIRSLDRRLERLQDRFKLLLSIIGGVAAAIIATIIAFVAKLI